MRHRFALLFFCAGLTISGLWAMQKRAPSAQAATPAPTAGRLTIVGKDGNETGLCPLKHTAVTADIAGYVARVTVRQEFANPSAVPIEALYTFPLPDDAAVDDMTLQVGDRTIKGRILRREDARAVYEAAKAGGKAAALLDQERPNIFTQAVANILPGEKVTITITYVNLLKYEEGRYEFAYPMVVGPRYTPGGGYKQPGRRGEPGPAPALPENPGAQAVVTDADKITPPITPPGTRAGHDISVTVTVDAGLPLQEITSVLHAVTVQRPGRTKAVVRLKNGNEIPNKDFILRFSAAGSEFQSGILAYAPGRARVASSRPQAVSGGGYFTLILQPPAAPRRSAVTPKEMVFVIDQTGSQRGWPIQKAKETMRHCLQSLNPGDTFQLIGFNTAVFPCFDAPVPNTPDNVQRALTWLEPIEGRGGTDILKSVDYALKLPDDPDRVRILCYMTDGFVGNDMQILDYIGKNRGRTRVFPLGVGNSVNRFLIEGMAREGRGQAEYVTLNAPGEVAAARFYRRVADPLLLDIGVDWNGLPVEDIYPKHIPDVFSAAPILLKGRYTRPGAGEITVRGTLRGRPWSQTLRVDFPAARQEGQAIATLWARARIDDLQNQDWLGAQTGNRTAGITEQIVNTALEYRLMSQHTSFVAVEEKVVNVGGRQRTVDVPVEMPEGVAYEGIFGIPSEQEMKRVPLGRSMSLLAAPHRGTSAAGGGFGGMAAATPAAPLPTLKAGDAISAPKIERNTEAGKKALAQMKPEERRALLAEEKLAPALRAAAAKARRAEATKADRAPVEVQVWLNELPPDGLARLKALGFSLGATLRPGTLLLGTIAPEKLDALVELSFVRRVEPPRFGP